MPAFSADFLLQKQAIWEDIFENRVRKMEKDIQWNKIVIHGVPIEPFSNDDGLLVLQHEIEDYNPGLKLLKKPVWLCSEEKRQVKKHASVLVVVQNAEQANTALKKKLCIAGNWLLADKYRESTAQTQCQKCQRFGHSTRACIAQNVCQICAEKHATLQHKCNICNIQGKECPHSALKCANCREEHKANSTICGYWKSLAENRKSRYLQPQFKKQTQQQQNENQLSHVEINNEGRLFW
jgi:hypothetical protein